MAFACVTKEPVMPWQTINRVPELFARMKEQAEAEGRKISMLQVANEANIDYSVAHRWILDRVTLYNADVASAWAAYFGEPVIVQIQLPDDD